MANPNRTEGHTIPSLDGLRAFSVALVIVGHLMAYVHDRRLQRLMSYVNYEDLGVRIFFVISGFLITGILLKEVNRTGHLSLRRFYFRRTLRIFPPFYCFVACVALLAFAGGFPPSAASQTRQSLLYVVTYTENYNFFHAAWATEHTWSLAVEEQFYLMWPVALVIFGTKKGARLAIAFLFLCPFVRVGYLAAHVIFRTPLLGATGYTFESAGDALAAGCLLAMFRDRLHAIPWYSRVIGSKWFPLIPVTMAAERLVTAGGIRWQFLGHIGIGMSIDTACICLLIDRVTSRPEGPVGRVLNWRPIAFVGIMSYSIYLWQELFVNPSGTWKLNRFPVNCVALGFVATASYVLVERPSLALRRRLERVSSPALGPGEG